VEVVELEERAGALDGVAGEDGRVHLDVAVLLEVGVDGLDDAVADAHDGPLPLAPQPQVPVVHEELDAVRLRRDRVVLGAAEQLDGRRPDLEAADLPLVGDDGAGDAERVLLRGLVGRLERGGVHLLLVHDALHEAGAVAEDEEDEALGAALVVEPAAEGDGQAFVPREVADGGVGVGQGGVERRERGAERYAGAGGARRQRMGGWDAAVPSPERRPTLVSGALATAPGAPRGIPYRLKITEWHS